MVFVVDLKWESGDLSCDEIVTSMTPTVRFDKRHFFCAQFCVVGSTLYMFEGESNSMYTYQLSDGISNLKLDKSMLSEGPPMNQAIPFPKVSVTPNGKILVFSECGHEECVFELYDPVDGVWEKLPSLCPSRFYNISVRDFDIEAFTFMKGGNVFFVKTEWGAYTLNITARNKVWKTNGFHCAERLPPRTDNSMVLINKEICIMSYIAYDITKYEENENVFQNRLYYKFPDLCEFKYDGGEYSDDLFDSNYDGGYSFIYGGVVLLENCAASKLVFNVCFLQSGINNITKDSELVLHVYSCNLKECRKGLRKYRQKKIEEHTNRYKRKVDSFKLPGAKKVKTLRIAVKYEQEPFYYFYMHSFASIPIEIACPEKK